MKENIEIGDLVDGRLKKDESLKRNRAHEHDHASIFFPFCFRVEAARAHLRTFYQSQLRIGKQKDSLREEDHMEGYGELVDGNDAYLGRFSKDLSDTKAEILVRSPSCQLCAHIPLILLTFTCTCLSVCVSALFRLLLLCPSLWLY